MKFENVQTVIWDCDGTIWSHSSDEIYIFAKEMNVTSSEMISRLNEEFLKAISVFHKRFLNEIVTHEGIIEVIDENIPVLKILNMTAHDFFELWKNIDTTTVSPYVDLCMKSLHTKGISNIVCTDWLKESQIRLLSKYNLLQYIDEIYTCEGFYLKSSSKNPPERIIRQDCKDSYLLIGDSANDMNFAQKMGIKFVWFNPSGKIDEAMNSTLEISSFKTLKDYF